MAPLIYLVRHGQTEYNAENRFQGQKDTDLNDTGRAQARRNGLRLRELIPDPSAFAFVASPMRRTRETMELVREGMGLPRTGYSTDPRLVEVHFGDWQGFTYKELEQHDPDVYERRQRSKWTFVPPGEGAESYAMLLERIRPWFDEVRQPTVCVAHGGTLRSAFRLTGTLGEDRAADIEIMQDKILRLENGRLDWL